MHFPICGETTSMKMTTGTRMMLGGALAAALLGGGAALVTAQQETPASPSIAKDSRLFEMRTYYAAPGKFEALHSRFRDHTNRLFRKHGMTLIGYWVPTDKAKGADNTLVYILAYPNKEAREKSWAGFAKDPEWAQAKTASEVNGKLVDKIDVVFLNATDYSPLK